MITTYTPRSIKRDRRSKAQIATLKSDIYSLLRDEQPMTIRHLFYRLTSKGVLEKNEKEYKGTLVRLLSDMRRNGEVPFHWLIDSTRWIRKPESHNSIDQLLKDCANTYRRSTWDAQPNYAEVWCEKDAIASILYETTEKFDVPLMVCRGFSSLSFIHSAAESIRRRGKPTYIFYLGDHDPSGRSISSVLERDLREFCGSSVPIIFERLAVTEDQILLWDLPTRPTKKSDSRSRNFEGDSVEVDAIPGKTLQVLVNNAIVDLIEPHAWNALQAAETSERESLSWLASNYTKLMRNELS